MEPDDIIRICSDVTKAMIIDTVRNGAKMLEEIQEAIGVGEVRGVCLDDIQVTIDEVISE